MSELVSIVLELRALPQPEPGGEVPLWWGRAAQQMLLSAVNTLDPSLAAEMHAEDLPRAYTVSSLLGRFSQKRLDANERYVLRVTGLTARVSDILLQLTRVGGALAPGQSVALDNKPFSITAVFADPSAHPWAGEAGYATLSAALVGENLPRKLDFHLASPLVFHSAGRTQPLPLPEPFFGGLLERWNAFAPIALPPETRRYAAEMLAVSRFDLESRAVHIKAGGLRVGAVGRVQFTALNTDRYWLGVLHTLAAFAQFAGAGTGAAQGMGQVRVLPEFESGTRQSPKRRA